MIKKPTLKSLQQELATTRDALETALALSPETDNNFFTGGLSSLYSSDGRNAWDRKKVFAESLRAYRVNPMARRIVKLTTSFIVGKGISISVKPKKRNWLERLLGDREDHTQKFLLEWWHHPLNNFSRNTKRWMDELTRTGNLFHLVTVDQSGLSYFRAVPSEMIEEIKTKENDVEQETGYTKDASDVEVWDAYDPNAIQSSFMLHYAVNQPVGSSWGEADMFPLLVWLGRYSSWLEDRVRLNRYRNAFMYVVRKNFATDEEKETFQRNINSKPPMPGTILAIGMNEAWGVMAPNLDSFDAREDGLAIKKNIASGIGFPLHYFAEPESATRTTAEAAGTPTFRTLEETQSDFFDMLISIARVALQVKSHTDSKINPDAEIEILGPDITERDNATLALAFARAYPNLADMFDRNLINEKKLLDLSMRMMAEPFEGQAPKGIRKNINNKSAPSAPTEDEPEPTDPKEDE
jgi:hypothetical protein